MISLDDVVSLSRIQFGATAMFHFLFVPLTLGLSWILVIAESAYVMTGKVIYKDITRFWGKLFGINFVMGVTTGITLEFQFGTNWAYYSHYVGDIFATPPPMAIMQALAKKAVPWRRESISVASKMRGWRVTKVRIQSRR